MIRRASSNVARKDERGFALLLVFLMAAAIAIMLYQQLPRVAFETEREKEQTLISRGLQYQRAIQMYFVANKKYPSKIEDLENTNNHRYLRKRFIDPMTGKDEWRVIHVNGAGQLTDSLVTKPPTPDGKTATGGSGATGASGATGTDGQSQEVNAYVRQRPSDRALVTNNPNQPPQNVDPNDPRYWPPITLMPSGATGASGAAAPPGQQRVNPQFPWQQFPGQQFPGQPLSPQQASAQLTGQPPGQPPAYSTGQQFPGQPGSMPPGFQPLTPAQIAQQQQQNPTGVTAGIANPSMLPVPGMPGQGINLQSGGIQPAGGAIPQNPAVAQINDMLRTPRVDQNVSTTNNPAFGAGGIAGFASTYNAPSIKVYKDRQRYNEWEFIFAPGQNQQIPGRQNNQQNTNGQSNTQPNNAQPNSLAPPRSQ